MTTSSTTLADAIAYTSDSTLGSVLVTDGASPSYAATYVLAGENSTITAAYATQLETANTTVTNTANATGALATDSGTDSVAHNGALAIAPSLIPVLLLLL